MRRELAARTARRSAVEEHVDADTAFHRSIVAAAHSPVLTGLFDGFVPRSRQAMVEMLRMARGYGGDADQDAHARLLDAVQAGDGQAAAALSRAHLLAMKQRLS